MSCHCGAMMTGIHLEQPGVATAFCASGHRIYLFKLDNGQWETQRERQRRLSRVLVCEDCGCDFDIPARIAYGTQEHRFCHGCKAKRAKKCLKENHARKYVRRERDRDSLNMFRRFAVRITARSKSDNPMVFDIV